MPRFLPPLSFLHIFMIGERPIQHDDLHGRKIQLLFFGVTIWTYILSSREFCTKQYIIYHIRVEYGFFEATLQFARQPPKGRRSTARGKRGREAASVTSGMADCYDCSSPEGAAENERIEL